MKKLCGILILALSASAIPLSAQFLPGTVNTSANVDVRKGDTISYSVASLPGEVFRWALTGGTIIFPAGAGTVADSSVIEFAAGLNVDSIRVVWDADDSTILSRAASIRVQKLAAGSCPSTGQLQPVTQWSHATASLDTTGVSNSLCSGDVLGGALTVRLTGAPDFDISYTIVATGLTDGSGGSLDAVVPNATTAGGTYSIPLPAEIVNVSTTLTRTFVVTLTAMNDDFLGAGSLIATTQYTITVYPTVDTGEISTSHRLNRR